MQITHLGHAAVLVETPGARVLIDPGNFSDAWHELTELDAVLITHSHPDHADPEKLPALIKANPQVQLLVEPTIAQAERAGMFPAVGSTALVPDAMTKIGDLRVKAVGGKHAVIHADIPQIGNVGYLLSGSGEPTLFHPGDMLTSVPPGVDLLGVPMMGPWAAMKETIDFVRTVGAGAGFPIHDGLLNERGRSLIYSRLVAMTGTEMSDLRTGDSRSY